MGKIKVLHLTWILAFLVVAKTSMNGKEEISAFQGVAETREVIVNSENPVKIREIHVIPGQEIYNGRLLLELERPELTMKINEISHQLEELKTRQVVDRDDIKSQIRQLKARKAPLISDINHEIKQLQSRYQFNKEMLSSLKSISMKRNTGKKTGAVEIEIENLKKERQLTERRFQTEINDLNAKLASLETPESIRQERLKKELDLLHKEEEGLLILAPINGTIGSIHCKKGEKVSPFQPILTLHTRSPSYVRGYIHEDIHNQASTGDKVNVAALTGGTKSIEGEIVGVGSRIVQYPLRLRKRPEIQMWGREVEIRLPKNNPFMLGEKVVISTEHQKELNYLTLIKRWFNLEIYAAESKNFHREEEAIQTISSSEFTGRHSNIEASGLVYLHDLDKYLVISDETKKKKPLLYLMDDQARITTELMVEGLDKIDDMEAICQDESGTIYLACSQARKKNGSLPDKRKLFVQISRSGTRLILDDHVLLYDLLKEAALENPDEKWARFLGRDDNNIEIEGMFVYQDALFLGFKKPLKKKQAVILRINNFHEMLQDNQLDRDQVQIWRKLDLQDQDSKSSAGISDLCLYQNQLLVLSSGKKKKNKHKKEKIGALRIFDFNNGQFIKTRYFNQSNPEGVTFNHRQNSFIITFDQGSDTPSKVMHLKDI